MARWVTYPEVADEIDYLPLLHDLGDDVVRDAKAIASPFVDSGQFRESIHMEDVDEVTVMIVADPSHPDETEEEGASYGAYVELGTSDTPKHPTLKPALYRYRSP